MQKIARYERNWFMINWKTPNNKDNCIILVSTCCKFYLKISLSGRRLAASCKLSVEDYKNIKKDLDTKYRLRLCSYLGLWTSQKQQVASTDNAKVAKCLFCSWLLWRETHQKECNESAGTWPCCTLHMKTYQIVIQKL